MRDLLRIGYDPGTGEDIPVLTVYLKVDNEHELQPYVKVINTLYGGDAMEMYLKLTSPGQCDIKEAK